jgi:NADH-quinone oxidoreductase subunit C
MSTTETTETGEEAEAEVVETDAVREAIATAFADQLGDGFVDQHIVAGKDLTIRIASSAWVDAARFARDKLGMTWLDFISGIDWLPSPFGRDMDAEQDWGTEDKDDDAEEMATGVAGGDSRFQVFMRLYSIEERVGVTIKADLDDTAPAIETLIPIFAGASWHERELSEMFGVQVIAHPDLRKLYLPSSFEGNPLRKDYPLVARRVKPWPGIVDVEAMPGDDDDDEAKTEGEES